MRLVVSAKSLWLMFRLLRKARSTLANEVFSVMKLSSWLGDQQALFLGLQVGREGDLAVTAKSHCTPGMLRVEISVNQL